MLALPRGGSQFAVKMARAGWARLGVGPGRPGWAWDPTRLPRPASHEGRRLRMPRASRMRATIAVPAHSHTFRAYFVRVYRELYQLVSACVYVQEVMSAHNHLHPKQRSVSCVHACVCSHAETHARTHARADAEKRFKVRVYAQERWRAHGARD